jgi:hypothetical protein
LRGRNLRDKREHGAAVREAYEKLRGLALRLPAGR